VGHSVISSYRLLNAPSMEQAIRAKPEKKLAVTVSEEVFAGAAQTRYSDLDPGDFTRVV
jgi:hypothetical protein